MKIAQKRSSAFSLSTQAQRQKQRLRKIPFYGIFSPPQIRLAEFAKSEKDLFQIRESLREFAAGKENFALCGWKLLRSKNFRRLAD